MSITCSHQKTSCSVVALVKRPYDLDDGRLLGFQFLWCVFIRVRRDLCWNDKSDADGDVLIYRMAVDSGRFNALWICVSTPWSNVWVGVSTRNQRILVSCPRELSKMWDCRNSDCEDVFECFYCNAQLELLAVSTCSACGSCCGWASGAGFIV